MYFLLYNNNQGKEKKVDKKNEMERKKERNGKKERMKTEKNKEWFAYWYH